MDKIPGLLVTVVIVMLLIVGIYFIAISIVGSGGENVTDGSKDQAADFGCIILNPDKSLDECRETSLEQPVTGERVQV